MDNMDYRIFTLKNESHKAFNILKGILQGVLIDGKIVPEEKEEIERWVQENEFLARYRACEDLFHNIEEILKESSEDDLLEGIKDLLWLCDRLESEFDYYDNVTTDIQTLQGVCHGIISDGMVSEEEILGMKEWLYAHAHLKGKFPYDEIFQAISCVLEDGKIEENERLFLLKLFNDFSDLKNPEILRKIEGKTSHLVTSLYSTDSRDIIIKGNTFCLSGNFQNASKKVIADKIESLGGFVKSSVSKKTNYLVVGEQGNPCWSYACYGRKVEKAMELNKQGAEIKIIPERALFESFSQNS
ncbi:MAG: hypothetical protein D6732_25455 [Methanobacteriota archaeon]|nr:MAG: hypothetical protein D6732_25455 [Euryarchaeota archaeon]